MTQTLSTFPTIPNDRRSDPRPRRQPLPTNSARPRAEALLRELAFVLKATRAVRESMSVR